MTPFRVTYCQREVPSEVWRVYRHEDFPSLDAAEKRAMDLFAERQAQGIEVSVAGGDGRCLWRLESRKDVEGGV